jgi:hypothetical protein
VVSVGAAMWIAGGVIELFALPRDAGSASTTDQINSPSAPL